MRQTWLTILALLLLIGCAPAQPESTPEATATLDTPVDVPTATLQPTQTVVLPGAMETAAPLPTGTPPPVGEETDTSPPPPNWEEMETWLVSAYQAGNTPEQLRPLLQEAMWQEDDNDFQAHDLTGDKQPEWLVTLFEAGVSGEVAELPLPKLGQFWIVNGQGRQLQLDNTASSFESAPEVVTVSDFTGDGIYDVVTAAPGCGAHTCTQNYKVFSSHHGSFENLVPVQNPDFEDSDAIAISYSEAATADYTGDGVNDFSVSGGIVGSAGAGIQQGKTDVYSFDGQHMTLVDTRWEKTDYRHHRLYDANRAFDAGDYAGASDMYQSAIEDDSLMDVDAFSGDPETRDDIQLFAAFRLVLIGLLQNDLDMATEWDSWMRLVYPDRVLTDAASEAIQTFEGSGSVSAACASVNNLIAPIENVVGGASYLGYNNPELTNENVCPVTAE